MTVGQVMSMASHGELKNISVGKDDESIVMFLNLGLIELYKRFEISSKEIVIDLLEDVDVYEVPDDVMWLTAAYGEVEEGSTLSINELPINSEEEPLSINTVGWNQVQIPLSTEGAYVSLIYVASPVSIVYSSDELYKESSIPLPAQMIEALLHYVGYRAHGSVDGNIDGENNTHYKRFDISCKRLKTEGMVTGDSSRMTNRLEGWV